MAKQKIKETFIRCPNCKRFKNANYKAKETTAKAICFCGTQLTKKIK